MINRWLEEEVYQSPCECERCIGSDYQLDDLETEEEYYVSRSNGRL